MATGICRTRCCRGVMHPAALQLTLPLRRRLRMFPPLNSIPLHIVLQDIQAQHLANYEAFQGYRRHDEAYTVPRICCLHRGIGAKSETYPNDGFKTEHRWQMEVAVALLKRAGWAHDELTAYRALAAGVIGPLERIPIKRLRTSSAGLEVEDIKSVSRIPAIVAFYKERVLQNPPDILLKAHCVWDSSPVWAHALAEDRAVVLPPTGCPKAVIRIGHMPEPDALRVRNILEQYMPDVF